MGLKAPAARSPRFVLLHPGCGNRFIDGAELTFLAKKNAEDYHDEMDIDIFENWFENHIVPSLPEEMVVVMDNAGNWKKFLPTHLIKRKFRHGFD